MRRLTPQIALELIAHEGLVAEAYKDSVGVWTWSAGITNASGHRVYPRYRDKPQPLEHCLGVYLWLLETRYLPPVLAAFGSHDPGEAELGAALSFHWNTGAIGRASWMQRFLAGDLAGARAGMLEWTKPASLLPRRRREEALFFNGEWSHDGMATVYDVAKPSYHPTRGRKVNVAPIIEALFAARAEPLADAAPATPLPTHSTAAQAAKPAAPGWPAPPRESWFDRLFG